MCFSRSKHLVFNAGVLAFFCFVCYIALRLFCAMTCLKALQASGRFDFVARRISQIRSQQKSEELESTDAITKRYFFQFSHRTDLQRLCFDFMPFSFHRFPRLWFVSPGAAEDLPEKEKGGLTLLPKLKLMDFFFFSLLRLSFPALAEKYAFWAKDLNSKVTERCCYPYRRNFDRSDIPNANSFRNIRSYSHNGVMNVFFSSRCAK